MAKTIKLSEKCSRCPREEEKTVSLEEAVNALKSPKQEKKALEIIVDGERLASYEVLCDECRSIVLSYADGASRVLEKKSSRRMKRVEAKKTVAAAPAAKPVTPPVAPSAAAKR
jgi:hypothetical protein